MLYLLVYNLSCVGLRFGPRIEWRAHAARVWSARVPWHAPVDNQRRPEQHVAWLRWLAMRPEHVTALYPKAKLKFRIVKVALHRKKHY